MSIETHACFVQANKVLAHDNTEIDFAFVITNQDVRPVIRTCKLDQTIRGKPMTLMASHCPFCGEKLS